MSDTPLFDPCDGNKFGRIPMNILFNDSLSAQEKLIIAYICGKMHLDPEGKVELKNETVAEIIGTKIGKNGERCLRQAKRYMARLKKTGLINIKNEKHSRWVWFKKPGVTNMAPLNGSGVTNMAPLNGSTIIEESRLKKSMARPDSFYNFHPYTDEIMSAFPKPLEGKIGRLFISDWLKKNDGNRPYLYWLFKECVCKDNPTAWVVRGMTKYYGAYLKSLAN